MQPARVDVELGFFPMMFFLFLCTPWISINGMAERRSWGMHTLNLPPGRHQIEAWYPYLFSSQTSRGSIILDVLPGGSYRVRYRPAWLVFLAGKMTLVSQPQLPQATARPPS